MPNERGERVEALYHAALGRAPSARDRFLDDECASDPELRAQVESLLRYGAATHVFFDEPAAQLSAPPATATSLGSGARIGTFEIVKPIGSGGMGEVFLARDVRLKRDVAIKVLPDGYRFDARRLARFEREAQLLASLNHPNIATLYGLEVSGDLQALVMEFVDGETLADRLATGPIPLTTALPIARQLVEALDTAHECGVVHRDLKPANIKVREDGTVKVLDFGLAKALDDGSSPECGSPTLTDAHHTIGTPAYMSPEQARGGAVDRRTDIWSFGCVLFEMLAGQRAFEAVTSSDAIAAVLTRAPDWDALPADLPPAIRRLLQRCLEKDTKQRLRDVADAREYFRDGPPTPPRTGLRHRGQAIGDARIASEETQSGQLELEAAPAPRRGAWRAWLLAALAGGAVVAVIASMLVRARPLPAEAPPVTRFSIALPPGQHLAALERPAIALSPDGRMLAYVAAAENSGPPRVYIRPMDSTGSRPVRGTEGGSTPFFSPNGQWLGFFADGKLKKVPVGGGDAQILAEVVNPLGASWERGTIAFAPYGSVIQQVSDTGGPVTAASRFEPGETLQMWPHWLPDAKRALFASASIDGQGIVLQSIGSTNRPEILRGPTVSTPRYVSSGHLVYAADGELMAVPFDLQHPQVKGESPATPIVTSVYHEAGTAQYTVSTSGTLAYVAGWAANHPVRLVWVTRRGGVEPIAAPAGHYNQPRLSPDGRRLAVDSVQSSGNMQVWLYDLVQDTFKPFTFEGVNRHAVWTPDSKRLVYMAQKNGVTRIVWQPADGSRGPEALTDDAGATASLLKIPFSVSRDGTMTFATLFPSRNAEVSSLNVAVSRSHPAPRAIMKARTADGGPQLSPDGRWLAYASDESGRGREIYVQSMVGPGGPWQVSIDGGNEPQWNPRGGELFYRTGNRMMAVAIDTTAGFRAGKPHELFRGDFIMALGGYVRANYDVSPDGQRFLMLEPVERDHAPLTEITVVLNWTEELRQLVPVQPN